MKIQKRGSSKKMRRAFVSLPKGVWDIIDNDFRGGIGEGDSEIIRNIVISFLSEKGYFVNEKDVEPIENVTTRLDVMENMIVAALELLGEKGQISMSEWNTRLAERLESAGSKQSAKGR